MLRQPAVAGRFYPADAVALRLVIGRCLSPGGAPAPFRRRAIACVVPHAGYIYSGGVAGAVYAALELPARSILLGPRHYPRGEDLAILSEGAWQTPLGEAPIDAPLAAALRRACPLLREDGVAHRSEHALEVQLPFLQHLVPGFKFVPVALGRVRLPELEALGQAVATVVQAQADPVLVVASSDFNHYESDEITRRKDGLAMDRILALDPPGLHETVAREEISMCGYAAATAMLFAARALGAKKAELIRYATSGDVSGDRSQVVGYGGIVIS